VTDPKQNFGLSLRDWLPVTVSMLVNCRQSFRLLPIENNLSWTFGMTISGTDIKLPSVTDVSLTDERLNISLSDGRDISVPVVWYPRLMHATTVERSDWRLIGDGSGIHWPQLDEDISVRNVIDGRRSVESQQSLQRWFKSRDDGLADKKSG